GKVGGGLHMVDPVDELLPALLRGDARTQIKKLAVMQAEVHHLVNDSNVDNVLSVLNKLLSSPLTKESRMFDIALKGQVLATIATIQILLDLPHKKQHTFVAFVNTAFSFTVQQNNPLTTKLRTDAALALYEVELAFPGILLMQSSILLELATNERTSASGAYTLLAAAVVPSGGKLAANAPRRARQSSQRQTDGPLTVTYSVPPSFLASPLQFRVPKQGTERKDLIDLRGNIVQLSTLISRVPVFVQAAIVGVLMVVSRTFGVDRDVVHQAVVKVSRGLASGQANIASAPLAVSLAVALMSPEGMPEVLADAGTTLLLHLGTFDYASPEWTQWLLFRHRRELTCYTTPDTSSPLKLGGIVPMFSPIVLFEALAAGRALGDSAQIADIVSPVVCTVKKFDVHSSMMQTLFVAVWVAWLTVPPFCGREAVLGLLVNLLLKRSDTFAEPLKVIISRMKLLSDEEVQDQKASSDATNSTRGRASLESGDGLLVDWDTDHGTWLWFTKELPLTLLRTAISRSGCFLGPLISFVENLFVLHSRQAIHSGAELLVKWLKIRGENTEWREQIACLNAISAALVEAPSDAKLLESLFSMIPCFWSPTLRCQATLLYNQYTRVASSVPSVELTRSASELSLDQNNELVQPSCPNGHKCKQGVGTMSLLTCSCCLRQEDPATCFYCSECDFYICCACVAEQARGSRPSRSPDVVPEGLILRRAGRAQRVAGSDMDGIEAYLSDGQAGFVLSLDLELRVADGEDGKQELFALEVHFDAVPRNGVPPETVAIAVRSPLEVLAVPFLRSGDTKIVTFSLLQLRPLPVDLVPTLIYSASRAKGGDDLSTPASDNSWEEHAVKLPTLTLAAEDLLLPNPAPPSLWPTVVQRILESKDETWITSRTSILENARSTLTAAFAACAVQTTSESATYLFSAAGSSHLIIRAEFDQEGHVATLELETNYLALLSVADEMLRAQGEAAANGLPPTAG
ncbi:hypothetical protein DIPPA_23643, partial [Diplonema papillatum]